MGIGVLIMGRCALSLDRCGLCMVVCVEFVCVSCVGEKVSNLHTCMCVRSVFCPLTHFV